MLAVPFVCAAAVAGNWNLPVLLAGIGCLGVFLLRGSMDAQGGWESWKDPAHLRLAGAAGAAGLVLVVAYARHELVWVAAAGAVLYAVQQRLVARHAENAVEKRSLAAELTGVAALSLVAPCAWIAARGRLERPGVELWLLNLLFFWGGVLYVKYRVRGLRAHRGFLALGERLRFAWPVFVYHVLLGALLVCWTVLEARAAAVLVAFTPGMLRAGSLLFQLGRRFPIRQLGWTEVVQAVVFAALLILAFRVAA